MSSTDNNVYLCSVIRHKQEITDYGAHLCCGAAKMGDGVKGADPARLVFGHEMLGGWLKASILPIKSHLTITFTPKMLNKSFEYTKKGKNLASFLFSKKRM